MTTWWTVEIGATSVDVIFMLNGEIEKSVCLPKACVIILLSMDVFIKSDY